MYTTRWHPVLAVALALGFRSAAAAANLIVQSPDNSNLKPAACRFTQYTALGDSYAAGNNAIKKAEHGPLPICNGTKGPFCSNTTSACAQNSGAYSEVFYNKYQQNIANFGFLACSGANTTNCSSTQVPNIPGDTDLVTIDIGGDNGEAFSAIVTHCVFLPTLASCTLALNSAQLVVDTISRNLTSLFGDIQRKVPKAKAIVLSYVRFWPPPDVNSTCKFPMFWWPDADQKLVMNNLVNAMNDKPNQSALASGFKYVDVNAYFQNHCFCEGNDTYLQWDPFASRLNNFDDSDSDGINDPCDDFYINMGVFHPNAQVQ